MALKKLQKESAPVSYAVMEMAIAFITSPDGTQRMYSPGGMTLFPASNAAKVRQMAVESNFLLKPTDVTIYACNFREIHDAS